MLLNAEMIMAQYRDTSDGLGPRWPRVLVTLRSAARLGYARPGSARLGWQLSLIVGMRPLSYCLFCSLTNIVHLDDICTVLKFVIGFYA